MRAHWTWFAKRLESEAEKQDAASKSEKQDVELGAEKQDIWRDPKTQGSIENEDTIPFDIDFATSRLRMVAEVCEEANPAMLRQCITEYVNQGTPEYEGLEHLALNEKWDELEARLDNDEEMLQGRLGVMIAAVLREPLRSMINAMRDDWDLGRMVFEDREVQPYGFSY